MSSAPNEQESEHDVRPCNICGNITRKTCGGCAKRRYCSRECQKKDWKLHKKYCQNQPTPPGLLIAYESLCEDGVTGFSWDYFLGFARKRQKQLAEAGGAKRKKEEFLVDLFQELLTEKANPGVAATFSNKPPLIIPERGDWDLAQALKKQKDEGKLEPLFAGFTYSFQTNGIMNDDGKLVFMLACSCMGGETRVMQHIVIDDAQREIPARRELEYLVYKSIAEPLPGNSPGYPFMATVCFAHRWTSAVSFPVMKILEETLGVISTFETKADARYHAAANGTDPNGFNFFE